MSDTEKNNDIGVTTNRVSKALGLQISKLRISAGFPAGQLAKEAGISQSMLSRVEKGLANPSIETLTRISLALDIPLSRFFVDQIERKDCSFVPAGQGVTVERFGSAYGHVYQLLGHVLAGNLYVEPYIVTLTAESKPWSTFQSSGLEFVHVLEGQVGFRFSDHVYDLGPGDSLLFHANGPHGPERIDSYPVRFLAVFVTNREFE